jgi:hypothetical protein
MGLPNYFAGLIRGLWKTIQGSENQVKLLGGYFKPAGTGAPTIISPGAPFWSVSRVSTGLFLVTLVGTFARAQATLGKVQCVLAGLQIDPAGSDQTLQVTAGPLTGNTFELYVTDTTTGAATDITQPVTPSDQGSFVHWLMLTSNDNTQQFTSPQL